MTSEIEVVTVSAMHWQLKNILCISKKVIEASHMKMAGNKNSHYYKVAVMGPISGDVSHGYETSLLIFGPAWLNGCKNIQKIQEVNVYTDFQIS